MTSQMIRSTDPMCMGTALGRSVTHKEPASYAGLLLVLSWRQKTAYPGAAMLYPGRVTPAPFSRNLEYDRRRRPRGLGPTPGSDHGGEVTPDRQWLPRSSPHRSSLR